MCDGTLYACNHGHQEWKEHGGWMYVCDGDCKRAKTILTGTIWFNKGWKLEDHLTLLFHYARINHRVCCSSSHSIQKSVLLSTFYRYVQVML